MTSEVVRLRRRLVDVETQRIKEYDDAYPDVGPGLSWDAARKQAMRSLGFTEEDLKENM